MCSGGDLDGDDYTVIWDHRLLPRKGHRYERCMSYVAPDPRRVPSITVKHVLDFMIDFMKNDSLGQVAHTHLAYAHDPQGTRNQMKDEPDCRAFSDECMTLASLHSTAVDFAKTGVAARMPRQLRRCTYPDFMEKEHKTSYVSDTPLSHMYRQINSTTSRFAFLTHYDNTLCKVPGMLDYIDFARTQKAAYDSKLSRLMNQYRLASEAEVVTGFILQCNDKYSSKNDHQMRVDIAQKYSILRDSFREIIHSKSRQEEEEEEEDGGRKAGREQRRLEAIVAAMYDVTFSQLVETNQPVVAAASAAPASAAAAQSRAMLSFPWIFHDVLGRLSRDRQHRDRDF